MINIDFQEIDKNNLFYREFFLLLYLKYCGEFPIERTLKKMEEKDLIKNTGLGYFALTDESNEKIDLILKKNVIKKKKDEEIYELARRMRDIYPSGKKAGQAYYWRDTEINIVKRLRSFFAMSKRELSDDQILKATSFYVNSFNGDFKYMQLLKYFIVKDGVSQLLAYIENEGQVQEDVGEDWTSNLI